MSAATPVLEIRDLLVAYGGVPAAAVDRMALLSGTMAGVVGGNGAGKSTLVNAVAGWSRGEPRVSGEILLDGQDVSGLPPHLRVHRGLILVPEGRGVFGQLSVDENLRAAIAHGRPDGRRPFAIDEVFDLFPRLAERRATAAGALSGGERQMLALARALRMGPRVLLMDEPSIGLAPRLIDTLLATVRRLVESGMTVLLVEQNVRAALDVVDTLHLLDRGRVVASGPADEMRNDPRITEIYLGAMAP